MKPLNIKMISPNHCNVCHEDWYETHACVSGVAPTPCEDARDCPKKKVKR